MSNILLEWKPIEWAPRDGTEILCYGPGNKGFAEDIDKSPIWKVDHWHKGGWWKMRPRNPYTHWMPLPEPPK